MFKGSDQSVSFDRCAQSEVSFDPTQVPIDYQLKTSQRVKQSLALLAPRLLLPGAPTNMNAFILPLSAFTDPEQLAVGSFSMR